MFSVAICSVFLLAGVNQARADSPSIAGAPTVVYGQQEFGNTASVPPDSNYDYNVFWLLNVTAGDRVKIDWASPGTGNEICVYPVGTNDYNVDSTTCYAGWQSQSANGANELVFTANKSGAMPLRLEDSYNNPGPYHFTAFDYHAAVLTMPALSDVPAHGTINVGVRNSEGGAISDPGMTVALQIKVRRRWSTIGHGSASKGVAAVAYSIPPQFYGQRVSLRAVCSGGGYQAEASFVRRVKVNPSSSGTESHTTTRDQEGFLFAGPHIVGTWSVGEGWRNSSMWFVGDLSRPGER